MKTSNYLKAIIITIWVLAKLTGYGQDYKFLGTYDKNGKPNYLEVPGDVVGASTFNLVSKVLPEGYLRSGSAWNPIC
ncbi:hypothetical protein [Luteibaculum oceani]|uniref:Uncharacterized protein n=1 Tax=Luteibaculum oceani TaxID=1294296 RepID=A0A5C6UQE9_9FLAO|nr:hypothetical protein [Luteibaculum oceani]TXC75562.1 hypothetical protein FRX97_11855 [Luteibaculum oceani]